MRLVVLDIGGTSIKYAKYDNGILNNFSECATEAQKGGAHLMKKIAEIISEMGIYDGIGISTAGQVDSDQGKIIYANRNIPEYTGMEVRKILEDKFHVPVAVENDVNAVALGEGYYGAAKNSKDFLCLTYGTGIGGAVVMDGKVFKGSFGSAGEFGSIIVHGDSAKTGTVYGGRYEEYASTTALVNRFSQTAYPFTNGREIFEQIENQDVKSIVDGWIQEIGHGLVTLIHIFNPEKIILGGGVMNQSYVIEKVRKLINGRIMPSFRGVEIVQASLGNKAGLWGAVYIAEQRLKQ